MIQAYLVDLDGTLVDTRRANFLAYQAALSEVGVAVDQDHFEDRAFGKNWRQFLPAFLSEAGVAAEPATIAARKAELYQAAAKDVEVNLPLVRLLQSRGSKTRAALVTSASAANVQAILGANAALQGLFDLIVTGDDVKSHKPHPECYLRALDSFDVHPSDCLAFEDSAAGTAAAAAACIPTLIIRFGE